MIIPVDHILKGLKLDVFPASDDYFCSIVSDAHENGESPYQIQEGSTYQYEFSDPEFSFEPEKRIITPFVREKWKGTLCPNIYVGTLNLSVVKGHRKVGNIELEVQSLKSSYREDYRLMLEEITEHCLDIILQLNTPINQSLTYLQTEDSQTLLQRFAFVSSIINSSDFKDAVNKILADPNSSWSSKSEQVDFRRLRRVGSIGIRHLVGGSNRQVLPRNHPLRKNGINSVPMRIKDTQKIDSHDTPENRFIKYALESFLAFLATFNEKIPSNIREHKEASALQDLLDEYLSHSYFGEVSRPITLKLNSPILQRKSGYREILKYWTLFDLAAKLVWNGGEDVYKAGKRDVASLYEYWVFFKLFSLFSETFNLPKSELEKIIVPTNDRVGLQLKQGKHLALHGVFDGGSRKLNINFSYNRSFAGGQDYPKQGSWTINMRPDYTLSVWPAEFDPQRAEKLELITHIHFDAKYRIDDFIKLVEDINLNEEKEENAHGRYKNADLLKMHAYKDAIRRTGGAYVLYPGSIPYKRNGFHEVMPGLGAFPLRPSKSNNGIAEIKNFVLNVVDHLVDRATQREHNSIKTHYIHKNVPYNKVKDLIPGYSESGEITHPNDTYVLVGYYKGDTHLHWIKEKGKYNARIGTDKGSVLIDKKLASVKYLLLHTKSDEISSLLFKVKGKGGRLLTNEQLVKLDYPRSPSQSAYLVFDIENIDSNSFGNAEWKFKDLKNYQPFPHSANPFTASLTELMSVKLK